jgi:hypothetical protein
MLPSETPYEPASLSLHTRHCGPVICSAHLMLSGWSPFYMLLMRYVCVFLPLLHSTFPVITMKISPFPIFWHFMRSFYPTFFYQGDTMAIWHHHVFCVSSLSTTWPIFTKHRTLSHWTQPQPHRFISNTINNNNMADARTCYEGTTQALHNIGPWNDVL